MALYSGAQQMLLPESFTQPRIRPRIVMVHTHVGNPQLQSMHDSLLADTAEHHFNLRIGGSELAQYVDTEVRADNNFQANSFMRGGVLCGAISIETGDRQPKDDPDLALSFSDLGEFETLVDLVAWCCEVHDIPCEPCPSPFEPGIGYHSMWGINKRGPGEGTYGRYDVPAKLGGGTARLNNPWTNALGKTCPGTGKIAEFQRLLDAVRARVSNGMVPHGLIRTGPVTPGRLGVGDDGNDFIGRVTTTIEQARAWAIATGAPADLVEVVTALYWELAPELGLRPEVPFAQAMIETANFTFPRCGITVCPDYCNPCGMRTAHLDPADGETPENHQRFPSWRDGIQAHLDHLALYLGLAGYPRSPTTDPRHFPFLRGKVVSLTNLGDWWVKGGAGPNPNYGAHIRERIDRMAAMPGGALPAIAPQLGGGDLAPHDVPEEEDDMRFTLWKMADDPSGSVYAVYAGYKVWAPDMPTFTAMQALAKINGWDPSLNIQNDANMFRAFGPVLGPRPSNYDEYGLQLV